MAACTPRICLQSTSGPQVVSGWDHIGTAQAVAFQTMKGLSFKDSRMILMAKQGGSQRLLGTQQWQTEP